MSAGRPGAGDAGWSYAIAVLAKEPRPGRVKTRLCPPYTLDEAARLAAAALTDTLDAATASSAALTYLVLDGDPTMWRRAGVKGLPQHGNGLAERLGNALVDVGAASGLPVLLLGMDTPQVTPRTLTDAARILREVDAVLGLARDGGFWTIGVQRPQRDQCLGVPMSQADTGQQQLQRLRSRGLRTATVETLTDVDDVGTARAVAREAPTTEFARELSTIDAARATS